MVSSEQLGQLLVVVEDDVGVPVLAGHSVSPQLLHEEHLVRELRGHTWNRDAHGLSEWGLTENEICTLSTVKRMKGTISDDNK